MKRIITLCATLMLCLSLGVSVLAAPTAGPGATAQPDREASPKTIFDEMQADFDKLTDSQKKQIYKIGDKLTAQYTKLIEKYAEFGLLSDAEADDLISRLESRNAQSREEGRMIHGFFPPPPSEAPAQ